MSLSAHGQPQPIRAAAPDMTFRKNGSSADQYLRLIVERMAAHGYPYIEGGCDRCPLCPTCTQKTAAGVYNDSELPCELDDDTAGIGPEPPRKLAVEWGARL